MSIYVYRCNQCGEVSEILVGVASDSEIVTCKHCGSNDLEIILSVSSFTFSVNSRTPGTTCCGREERCDTPLCTTGGICRRDQ